LSIATSCSTVETREAVQLAALRTALEMLREAVA
jgi:hypothetical protein